jgi:hypothetical protein
MKITPQHVATAAALGVSLRPGDSPEAIAILAAHVVNLQRSVLQLEQQLRELQPKPGLLRRLRGGA